MIPHAQSPIHRLVSRWWGTPAPALLTTNAKRLSLWLAAVDEMVVNQSTGTIYDPLADNRFLWAAQWLDVGSQCRRSIDPSVALAAEYIFDPPRPPSRQHLAAGS